LKAETKEARSRTITKEKLFFNSLNTSTSWKKHTWKGKYF